METTSTKQQVDKIIAALNAQDHTQISIDKFLHSEQLINELSQESIDFSKLRKYGCPSDYISCRFACKGIKPNASPKLCEKCWEDALTTTIKVDNGEETIPSFNEKNDSSETVMADADSVDTTQYEDLLETPISGANYFATAAQSLKEQFTRQSETRKKKGFFSKKENKKNHSEQKNGSFPKTKEDEFSKLKCLGLSPDEILKVFELLEWNTIQDFDLLCDILQN